MENIRVKLKADLTQYAKGLLPGVEGYTIGRYDMWSMGSDRFVGVNFPGIAKLDVLWSSLEIIDSEYPKEVEDRREVFKEELKTAKNVVKVIGPRGGFKYLSYEYIGKDGIHTCASVGFKSQAENIIKLFNTYGVFIETKVVN